MEVHLLALSNIFFLLKVVDRVVPGVTHVVAANDGTDKCLAARKLPGCVLVKATWLVECYWSMTRRDVQPHLLAGGGVASKVDARQPLHESEPGNASDNDCTSDSDGSDEDEDFAASLEEAFGVAE
jgi:RNA polymerase II subunit A C-terminal domain phosphatase